MDDDQAALAIVQFIKLHYNYDLTGEQIAAETGLTIEQVREVFAHQLQPVCAGYYRIGMNVRKATAEDAYGKDK